MGVVARRIAPVSGAARKARFCAQPPPVSRGVTGRGEGWKGQEVRTVPPELRGKIWLIGGEGPVGVRPTSGGLLVSDDMLLSRLRLECREKKRLAELARRCGVDRSYLSRIKQGKRPLTGRVRRALLRCWADDDGRLHAVAAAPPRGTLAEAVRLRAGDWSAGTVRALRALADLSATYRVECTVGHWIDCGDQIESKASSEAGFVRVDAPPDSDVRPGTEGRRGASRGGID